MYYIYKPEIAERVRNDKDLISVLRSLNGKSERTIYDFFLANKPNSEITKPYYTNPIANHYGLKVDELLEVKMAPVVEKVREGVQL